MDLARIITAQTMIMFTNIETTLDTGFFVHEGKFICQSATALSTTNNQ